MTKHLFLILLVFGFACTQPRPHPDSHVVLTYSVQNGLDCHMMNDCGYSFVVQSDGLLTQFDDQGQMMNEISISNIELNELVSVLATHEFDIMPSVLPEIPEVDMPRGGRTITIEHTILGQTKIVRAYPDVTIAPIRESFYLLESELNGLLIAHLN